MFDQLIECTEFNDGHKINLHIDEYFSLVSQLELPAEVPWIPSSSSSTSSAANEQRRGRFKASGECELNRRVDEE